jgi:hypothetical protein
MPNPARKKQSQAASDFRVVIQNQSGRFLAGGMGGWYFTEERTGATIFHYVGDRVAEQLEALRQSTGTVLEAVPVPMEEVYEVCDGCKELFAPMMVVFDGKSFFCADCQRKRRGRPEARSPKSETGFKTK